MKKRFKNSIEQCSIDDGALSCVSGGFVHDPPPPRTFPASGERAPDVWGPAIWPDAISAGSRPPVCFAMPEF